MIKKTSRRGFLATGLAGAASMVLPSSLMGSSGSTLEYRNNAPAPSLQGKKVLYVYGGWDGHEPEESVDIFVPWMESEGADVTVSDTLDSYLDEELMSSLDLIVQIWTMGEISRDQQSILLKTIQNGTGIAGWHGGLGDSFRNSVDYQFMVGGQWVAHPGDIIDYRVNITRHDDPVVQGLSDFDMHSEQYFMHVDPNVHVLATTKFTGEHAPWIEGCTMPVTWKKYFGKGRVFYTSVGHVMADFEVPEAMTMLQRGIRWASESKYHPFEPWINPKY
ncbi:ThuA domain-containing protein [Balneolaceae bacterium ANBcel3]|nr:ThuA domain-containing protein [Balneolaceae bacterium ANBcel3]